VLSQHDLDLDLDFEDEYEDWQQVDETLIKPNNPLKNDYEY
jgi:hypothetical protein